MSNAIIEILRQRVPTGPAGFEGLVAQLLEKLTGRRFYLARSGSQAGRDISSDFQNCSVIAVECKRYGKNTELDRRRLLGELVQASQDIPDLDLWVLVASRSVPSQVVTALAAEAYKQGIEFLSISADDGSPSSLAALCGHGSDVVLQYVGSELSLAEQQELRRQLGEIIANSGNSPALESEKELA
ncbi:MAG: restriction endonuclease [Deltaproteobacteria bacterium]|nr:restriction endonuclease [Deltaproteobacteria bacterium]